MIPLLCRPVTLGRSLYATTFYLDSRLLNSVTFWNCSTHFAATLPTWAISFGYPTVGLHGYTPVIADNRIRYYAELVDSTLDLDCGYALPLPVGSRCHIYVTWLRFPVGYGYLQRCGCAVYSLRLYRVVVGFCSTVGSRSRLCIVVYSPVYLLPDSPFRCWSCSIYVLLYLTLPVPSLVTHVYAADSSVIPLLPTFDLRC